MSLSCFLDLIPPEAITKKKNDELIRNNIVFFSQDLVVTLQSFCLERLKRNVSDHLQENISFSHLKSNWR